MKNVLIIDAPPMFREFLKNKLSEEKVNVVITQEKRDALIKITSVLPDLVIIDINEFDDPDAIMELFQKIKADPNASRIPTIATGPKMDKSIIETYAKFGIHKYFIKPIKFDIFFESIGKILHTSFSMDSTPCVLDIHRNGDIIFIEIAQGLNREKLALLKYKLSEIIENNEIETPKIILMMTNLELSFVDGLNLELLIDNILSDPKVHTKNVKVLSFSTFTQQLIDGHPQYDGIEVATDISQVLNSFVESTNTSRVSDLIADRILSISDSDSDGSIEMRFSSDAMDSAENENLEETKIPEENKISSATTNSTSTQNEKDETIAVIDDDQITLKLCYAGFTQAGYKVDLFSSGIDFLANMAKKKYKAIILDILMPGVSGFDTLKRLQGLANKPPIVIYSQAIRKDIVLQALSLGAKSFIVKPQKPEVLVSKVQEILSSDE
ncbi:MAG: response regulator [Treponema sp.]|jgi:DNA-binding response OmpR family regulator|nr:response regulator [Treponema sp.]